MREREQLGLHLVVFLEHVRDESDCSIILPWHLDVERAPNRRSREGPEIAGALGTSQNLPEPAFCAIPNENTPPALRDKLRAH